VPAGTDLSKGDWDPEWNEIRALQALMVGRAQAITLEIGCGDGRLLSRLGERGERAIGVDASLPAIARGAAQSSARGRLVVADALTLPFADGAFDQAILGWSL
jgi:SAM-dependent methyltransferase